jgi:hypothetical protein
MKAVQYLLKFNKKKATVVLLGNWKRVIINASILDFHVNDFVTPIILFYSIFRHLSSIPQSMAYWTSVQVKKVFPSELFPYPEILFSRHFLVKVETKYTGHSPVNAGVS